MNPKSKVLSWPVILIAGLLLGSLVSNYVLADAMRLSWSNEREQSANLVQVKQMLTLERKHVAKLVTELEATNPSALDAARK